MVVRVKLKTTKNTCLHKMLWKIKCNVKKISCIQTCKKTIQKGFQTFSTKMYSEKQPISRLFNNFAPYNMVLGGSNYTN